MADRLNVWRWGWFWVVFALVLAAPAVAAAGEPPVCYGDDTSTPWGTPVPIELECEGEGALTYEIVEGAEIGEIIEFDPEDGSLVFVPSSKYVGYDGFMFSASNGSGQAEPAPFGIQVTRPHAPAGTPEHQLTFGGYGFGEGRFRHPADVAVGPEGHVFVVDSLLHLVQEFTHAGKFVGQFGSFGDGPGELNHPSAIAVEENGSIWIADTGNSRIQRFDPDGEYVSQFGSHGSHIASLEGTDELDQPTGIAVGPDGGIYVSDTLNRRVLKFSQGGSFRAGAVFTGGFGPASDVSGLAPEPTPTGIAVGPEGNVWVADRMTVGLLKFNEDLEYLGSTSSPAMRRPDTVDVDAQGDVWAGDEGKFRVVRFDDEGSFLSDFGSWSGFPGGSFDFRHSFGIDIDDHNHVWITDPANYRVQGWAEHTGQAPYCEEASATTAVDAPLHLDPGGLGCEGNSPLTFELTTPPEHGEVTEFDSETGALKYTPDPEYNGPDGFGFEVTNAWGPWVEDWFSVEVGEAPKCEDLELSTATDEELSVELDCSGDYAEDGYEVVKGPAHGEISAVNPATGALTYTPDSGFQGTDKFVFQRESWIHTARATATIGVCEPPALEVGGAIATPEAPGVDIAVWAWPDSYLCPGVTSISVSIDEELVYSEERECGNSPDGCQGMDMVREVQLPFAEVLGSHEFEIEAEDEFGQPAESAQLTKQTDEAGTVWDLGAEVSAEGKCSSKPHLVGSVMIGTKCDDTIGVNRHATLYRTRAGDDVVRGSGQSETFVTSDGKDIVVAGRGSDIILSGGDDDRVVAGSGDDEVSGGGGEDTLIGGPGADKIKGDGENDLVRGGATTDKLIGGGGQHNTLSYADAVNPGFYFHPGSPLVTGFPEKHGGRGVYVNLSTANPFADNGEVARFGGGIDEIPKGDFQDVIGSPFADLIIGSDGANIIDGGAGTDIVRGRAGADTVYGGPDQDYLDGGIEKEGEGEDALDGGIEAGEGSDVCIAGNQTETCDNTDPETALVQPAMASVAVGLLQGHSTGSEDSVYIRGTGGGDDLEASGGASAVTVESKAGMLEALEGCSPKGESGKEVVCNGTQISSVLMWGGAGVDVLRAGGFSPRISVDLLGGDGADKLYGSNSADDVLVDGPDTANDHLIGKKGDDTLFSNWGKDTLLAGGGDDLFVSASLCDGDSIVGGPGIDNANWAQLRGAEIEPTNPEYPAKLSEDIFFGISHGANARLGRHTVTRQGTGCKGEGEEKGSIHGVEDLEGSDAPDVLVGDAGPNILLGRAGSDVLRGRAGNDVILANNRNPRGKGATNAERKDLDRRLECGAGNADGIKLDPADMRHFYPLGVLSSCETRPRKMVQRPANWRFNPDAGEPELEPEVRPEFDLSLDERVIGAVDDPDAPGPAAFYRLDETEGTDTLDWMTPEAPEGGEGEGEEETESEEELEEIAQEELEEEEWTGEPEEEPQTGSTLGAYEGGVVLDQEGAIEGSRAIALDGVDDFLDLTSEFDPAGFVFNNCGMNVSGYSIEMWVKFAAEPGAREELFSRSAGAEGLFLYRAPDGTVKFSMVDGVEEPTVSSDQPVDDSEWHQIVAVMAQRGESCASRMAVTAEGLESLVSPAMVLYVDGFPQILGVGAAHQSVIPENLTSSKNLIGVKLTTGGLINWLAGSVDDVAIYGHPLSFDEIQEHLAVSEALQPSAYLEPSVDLRDFDEDGVVDSVDNCAEVANKAQEDADLDGVGDACEPAADEDEDGVVDEVDNCPEDINPLQEDLNENEIGDACEATEEEGE